MGIGVYTIKQEITREDRRREDEMNGTGRKKMRNLQFFFVSIFPSQRKQLTVLLKDKRHDRRGMLMPAILCIMQK